MNNTIRRHNEHLHTILKRMQEHHDEQVVYEHALAGVGVEARHWDVGMSLDDFRVLVDFHYYLLNKDIKHDYEICYTKYSFYATSVIVGGVTFRSHQFLTVKYYEE